MPKREDEYWAGRKEPKGIGLCPFCGSPNVYYSKKFRDWNCGNCEKSFPSPSYGPGEDFGKEARWFGKSTESERSTQRKKRGVPGCLIFLILLFAGFMLWFGLSREPIVEPITEPTPVTPTPAPTPVVPPEAKSTPSTEVHSGWVWLNENTYLVGGDWKPIVLVDNPTASDPSYLRLYNFLLQDITDTLPYTSSRICVDFAEEVHNNAERQGIKAALVCLTGVDHALNAFQTTDRGLVFVDCTNEEYCPFVSLPKPGAVTFGEVDSCDKIAYVQIGKPLGVISLRAAEFYGFQYTDYLEWKNDVELFNAKMAEYDRQLAGRTYVSEYEYQRLNEMLYELKELDKRIGGFWEEPSGVVSSYKIIWEGRR